MSVFENGFLNVNHCLKEATALRVFFDLKIAIVLCVFELAEVYIVFTWNKLQLIIENSYSFVCFWIQTRLNLSFFGLESGYNSLQLKDVPSYLLRFRIISNVLHQGINLKIEAFDSLLHIA
jgi:hypothetical protein